MHLFALIAVTMCAFAANSVLSRAAIDVFGMDAFAFSGVRLMSGAAVLIGVVAWRGRWPALSRAHIGAALAMLIYVIPFSIAYLTLPSGVGALVLFGVVQLTMFAGSAVMGVRPHLRQWFGMGLAMVGLGVLLWPTGDVQIDAAGAAFMALAGVAWGVFSMIGRVSRDPLGDTAWSFTLLIPLAGFMMAMGPRDDVLLAGYVVAVVCGAITSGLGYALWYRVLPQVAATTGAVAQLSVPVIALIAGALVLGEAITLDVVVASAVVLGGIAVSIFKKA